MKALKDKFVQSDIWYFVASYLHDTNFTPIFRRKLEKYDKETGRPQFKMEWLDMQTFEELAKEAVTWYCTIRTEDMTEENIDKFAEK